jgi:hypothetical protein
MTHAALNAARVYKACRRALDVLRAAGMDSGEHEQAFDRLGRVADLAHHVASVNGDEAANIFVSAEDFALFAGHWPKP